MTLLQLRTLLRRRIDDVNSRRWADADLTEEINLAIRYVIRELSVYELDSTLWSSHASPLMVDKTVITDRIPFPNLKLKNLIRGMFFVRVDASGSGILVDIAQLNKFPNSMSDSGEWAAAIAPGLDPEPGALVNDFVDLEFNRNFDFTGPTPTDSHRFRLFVYEFSDLVNDGDTIGDDNMQTGWQELATIRAALMLIGSDNANFDFLSRAWNDGYAKLKATGYRVPQNTAMPITAPQPAAFGGGIPA